MIYITSKEGQEKENEGRAEEPQEKQQQVEKM